MLCRAVWTFRSQWVIAVERLVSNALASASTSGTSGIAVTPLRMSPMIKSQVRVLIRRSKVLGFMFDGPHVSERASVCCIFGSALRGTDARSETCAPFIIGDFRPNEKDGGGKEEDWHQENKPKVKQYVGEPKE